MVVRLALIRTIGRIIRMSHEVHDVDHAIAVYIETVDPNCGQPIIQVFRSVQYKGIDGYGVSIDSRFRHVVLTRV